jgi:hypothetical protein
MEYINALATLRDIDYYINNTGILTGTRISSVSDKMAKEVIESNNLKTQMMPEKSVTLTQIVSVTDEKLEEGIIVHMSLDPIFIKSLNKLDSICTSIAITFDNDFITLYSISHGNKVKAKDVISSSDIGKYSRIENTGIVIDHDNVKIITKSESSVLKVKKTDSDFSINIENIATKSSTKIKTRLPSNDKDIVEIDMDENSILFRGATTHTDVQTIFKNIKGVDQIEIMPNKYDIILRKTFGGNTADIPINKTDAYGYRHSLESIGGHLDFMNVKNIGKLFGSRQAKSISNNQNMSVSILDKYILFQRSIGSYSTSYVFISYSKPPMAVGVSNLDEDISDDDDGY